MPNSSFENYTSCPNSSFQIYLIPPWSGVANTGTSDYFNTCSTVQYCSVPTNFFGSQHAFSGSGYCGLISTGGNQANYREYVTAPLTSPLISGAFYKIGFYASLSEKSRVALDCLGAFLSNGRVVGQGGSSHFLPATPQIRPPVGTFISDSINWTLISGTYIANGGESHITLGNFYNDTNTSFLPLYPNAGFYAHYYVDDVYVIHSINIIGKKNICLGDSVTLLATKDSAYSWVDSLNPNVILSTDSFLTISPTVTTTYFLYGSSADKASFTVNVDRTLPVVNLGNDTTICRGDKLLLDAGNTNVNYLWYNNTTNSTLNVSRRGIYWVRVTNGCGSTTDSIIVNYKLPPTVNLGGDTVICQGYTLILNASNTNSSYQWQDNSTDSIFIVSKQGNYWVEVNNGCGNGTDTVLVKQDLLPNIDLGNDTLVCKGDTLLLNASNISSNYRWQNNSTDSILYANKEGKYWVQVTNGCGSNTDTITISNYDSIELDLGNDTTLCKGEAIILDATSTLPSATYLWQDSSYKATYKATNNGVYFVTINTYCETKFDSIAIDMMNCECQVYYPNSFTPNGDRLNDYFMPKFNCDFSKYKLQIFNRWGEQVFETTDPYKGWDGTFNTSNATQGSYVYILNYESTVGTNERIVGKVILIK